MWCKVSAGIGKYFSPRYKNPISTEYISKNVWMIKNKSLVQLSIGNNLMLFLGQKKHGIVVDPLNFEFLYFSALMYLIVVTKLHQKPISV